MISVEFGQLDPVQWSAILAEFRDSSIYQTWAYGSACWGPHRIRHAVIRNDSEVVAAGQIRIANLIPGGLTLGYLPWGPMVQLRRRSLDWQLLGEVLIALQLELVQRRGLALRILPSPHHFESTSWRRALARARFEEPTTWMGRYETFLFDLDQPEDELRRTLDRSWRRNLTIAEGSNIEVTETADDSLFDRVAALHREMTRRKRFHAFVTPESLERIQRGLPGRERLRVTIARSRGIDQAAIVYSTLGDSGLFLLGATSPQGRKSRASYLLHGNAIRWLRANGRRVYDLGGVSDDPTDGVRRFKQGLLGRRAKIVAQAGPFDGARGRVESFALRCIDRVRSIETRGLSSIARLRW